MRFHYPRRARARRAATELLRAAGLCVLGALLVSVASAHGVAPSLAPRAGEAIYRDGRLPSGLPLTALREPDMRLTGAAAACSNCHRRSGLGEIEGHLRIPPISGAYLFHPRSHSRDDLDIPYVEGMHFDRDPYTAATLARAIRAGLGADDKPLNYLMPHYSLDDADMAALIDYLKSLSPSKVPGVDGAVVHFATIVTPDADPVKRQAMFSVLEQYFADQNSFALRANPRARAPNLKSMAKRRWQLHVWELSGEASTWAEQLQRWRAREPVYAVLAGLGGKDWGPVHRFCESAALPCIFPNVEVPVVAEHDFYSLYYSRGVLLEADLLAQQLTATQATGAVHVVQVFRTGDVGAAAAMALHDALAAAGIASVDRPLTEPGDERQLAAVLKGVKPADTVVLWLRAADVAQLDKVPVRSAHVLMSGLMAGLEAAPLPPAWRAVTRLAYPVDLPDQRVIRLDYARGWMVLHHIPVLAEQVQVDTYVACRLVLEALDHTSGTFNPEYLVERFEGMLEHQLISGYYPRLGLAPNERFASKGGYIVHFAKPTGPEVLADSDWQVP